MELLEKIIALEWAMFQLVQNEGGRASCQDNYPTFRIMRESQFSAWPDAVLRSYLSDLEQAEAEGRNLVMEKYARMMERTAPERYREISAYLPPLGTGETEAIRQIMDIQQNWTRARRRPLSPHRRPGARRQFHGRPRIRRFQRNLPPQRAGNLFSRNAASASLFFIRRGPEGRKPDGANFGAHGERLRFFKP